MSTPYMLNLHPVTISSTISDAIGLEGTKFEDTDSIGKTKVFLRAGQMAELDTRRSEILGKSASIIQRKSQCRKYSAKLHFRKLKKATITTQCAWRGKIARRELQKLKMAARETGALQAAKNKLEKQVEDLTLRLQLEKRMRVDMEEAKTQENKRLQSSLHEMQLQFKETKALLEKEREAAKRAAEIVPTIKEVPVIDHALLEKLTSENEKLKTVVCSLEKKIGETEKRVEEKFSNIESENQVLQYQPLRNPSVKKMSEHLSIPVAEKQENGHPEVEEHKAGASTITESPSVTPVKKFGTESDSKLRRSYTECQHENVDALINCVTKNIGFTRGKPIAAISIYKCLLHWKSFEAERTSVFDRLIQMIGSAIENQDDNDLMAYWLSNTSALLSLLQQSLKSGGTTEATPVKKTPNPTSLFGRMTMGFLSSPSSASLAAPVMEVVRKVEAKYPALLFKQQLTAYVEKIYGIIRDNLKKELSSLLSLCIQILFLTCRHQEHQKELHEGRSFAKDSPTDHWQSIIESLNTLLCTLKENFVPPVLTQKIFTQTFSYINVQLFNSNGEYVKAGLAELELWCCQAKEEYAGPSWDELKHIRQAVGFLVFMATDDDAAPWVCFLYQEQRKLLSVRLQSVEINNEISFDVKPDMSWSIPAISASQPRVKVGPLPYSDILVFAPENVLHLYGQLLRDLEFPETASLSHDIKITGLADAVGGRVNVIVNNMKMFRCALRQSPSSLLANDCITALAEGLSFSFYRYLLGHLWKDGDPAHLTVADYGVDSEWDSFCRVIMQLCRESNLMSQKHLTSVSHSAWDFLLSSQFHRNFCKINTISGISRAASLDQQEANSPSSAMDGTQVSANAFNCELLMETLESRHAVYESLKLDNLRKGDLELLAILLCNIAEYLGEENYLDHYSRDFPGLSTQFLISRTSISWKRKTPPNLFRWLEKCLQHGCTSANIKDLPPLICKDGSSVASWARKIVSFYSILSGAKFFGKKLSSGVYCNVATGTHCSKEELTVLAMVGERFGVWTTTARLTPLRCISSTASYKCRDSPPNDWPSAAYVLLGRQDLAMSSLTRECKYREIERPTNVNVISMSMPYMLNLHPVTISSTISDAIGLEGTKFEDTDSIGKTKVFLRAGQMAELDTRRSEILGKSASIIQRKSQCRKYSAKLHFRKLKKATITTQCAWRGKIARRELRKLKMAARETGALQAAKNKLEKQVEDLTLRLQLEKRMRVDMEEAKTQENKRLQSSLHEMQLQFKETKALLEKEREAAKRAAEIVPIIKEVPVIDHALLEKLTSENEKLKTMVCSLEKKIGETEKRYEEANKISEERLKQAMEAESKIIQLKTSMQRLEEKFSNIESENQVLQYQPLRNPSVKKMSEHLSIPVAEKQENGHPEVEEHKAGASTITESPSVTPVKKFGTESDSKLRRSYTEHQHENVDALINCVTKNIGFTRGKPIAAISIYKCLLHWKSFEAERTSVFDRLIQMIGSAIENQDDNDLMAYWLSNTSALLSLLQQSLKSGGTTEATPVKKTPNPTSLFGRMTMGFLSSPSSASLAAPVMEVVRKVEAKYPALLFKQQLTAYVEKIYGIIRDNLKKELSSLLSLCIQILFLTCRHQEHQKELHEGRSFAKDSPTDHWQSIIESLNTLLCTLKENFVPPVLTQKIFTQTFSYINVQLFNSNGEYVKAGLAELELWCCQAKEEYAGPSWDELKHIRQAVGFLVIHQKYRISYDEITNDLCPILSVQQLYRICTLYWDGNYNTRSVSPYVISSMKMLMAEDSNDALSDSFLLDDNSRCSKCRSRACRQNSGVLFWSLSIQRLFLLVSFRLYSGCLLLVAVSFWFFLVFSVGKGVYGGVSVFALDFGIEKAFGEYGGSIVFISLADKPSSWVSEKVSYADIVKNLEGGVGRRDDNGSKGRSRNGIRESLAPQNKFKKTLKIHLDPNGRRRVEWVLERRVQQPRSPLRLALSKGPPEIHKSQQQPKKRVNWALHDTTRKNGTKRANESRVEELGQVKAQSSLKKVVNGSDGGRNEAIRPLALTWVAKGVDKVKKGTEVMGSVLGPVSGEGSEYNSSTHASSKGKEVIQEVDLGPSCSGTKGEMTSHSFFDAEALSSDTSDTETVDDDSLISHFENEEGLLIEQLEREFMEEQKQQNKEAEVPLDGFVVLFGGEGEEATHVDDLTSSLQEKDFSDVKPAEGHQRLAEPYWAEPKNTRGCSGIKEEVVLSPAHALSLIATGEEHRHVGSNNFNLVSSRCHTIFTLTIESSSHGEDTGEEDVILSHLHLIDLAGSESSKTETTGLRRKEGSYINKSLLTLGTVISKLTDGKATHIPYRDSKLTRLLQSSLSGHGQIFLICTVTPASSSSEETHNTLKFASRSKHVEIKAAQNKIMDEKSLIKKYQREIHDLKQELQQLKHGIMENPNVAVSSQEDLVNLKLQLEAGRSILQSRLEEEEQAKAALMGRIQRLTKLILVSTKTVMSSSISESSGKTHTMHGEQKSPHYKFRELPIKPIVWVTNLVCQFQTPGREFLLPVSYLEIYNEVINDLLNPTGQNLRIREDAQGTYVEGINEEVVLSPGHALSLIATGEGTRNQVWKQMNRGKKRTCHYRWRCAGMLSSGQGACHAIGGLLPVLCTPQANIRRPLAPATTTVMHVTPTSSTAPDVGKAKENVTVTVRFRPLSARELNKGDEIAWYADGDHIVRNEHNPSVAYGFDKVFGPATTTRHVYDLADGAMEEINGTVFAYGVTSSGKTHTMHGEQKSPGIIPLATPGREFLLRVSYLEIYNEVINDLLNPTGQNLRIREDAQGTYVEGIKEEVVLSPAHALSLIATGEEHRHVGSNNFNLVNSRSHTIFTLTIESSSHGEDTGEEDVILSHLHLIDLAGSESSKTETTGLRRKEGSYINKSLLTLGTVISKLTDGKAIHIPYRDSKLTRLLQSSLSGHGQISLICTVTPTSSSSEETHNTLKFASRSKHVEIKAAQNKIMDDKSLIKKYQREIHDLKQELQQLKHGIMENPNVAVSSQEDLVNLKLQSRLEEEEQAKAALMGRIQRLTKLILVSTKTFKSSSISERPSHNHRRRHSFGED
ncbi:myosin-6-like isoform X2 [Senna tora]|uniref:Myosin-6-like isoform X2 n=2 Tax=Magnoliopsida TaxID=3398 RepID=A0A834X3V2_9FABA|nr:myosin-6-like isoform X2 [Senna tora]